MPLVRSVCNISFDDYRAGEIVDADSDLCRAYFDNGWLTPVDSEGERIIPLVSQPHAPG